MKLALIGREQNLEVDDSSGVVVKKEERGEVVILVFHQPDSAVPHRLPPANTSSLIGFQHISWAINYLHQLSASIC